MLRITVIGSGSWGTVIAHTIAESIEKSYDQVFDTKVTLWTHKIEHKGKTLEKWINEKHENPIYFPDKKISENVKATEDLEIAVHSSEILIITLAQKYLKDVLDKIGLLSRHMILCLTKGLFINNRTIITSSQYITMRLGVECSVWMGGTIAEDLYNKSPCEATLGYANKQHLLIFSQLFRFSFAAGTISSDIPYVEICAFYKNIIAMGIGIANGFGCGINTTSALIRIGMIEISRFINNIYKNVVEQVNEIDPIVLHPCGIGDLIATSMEGRNMKITRKMITQKHKTIENLESGDNVHEGPSCLKKIAEFLIKTDKTRLFPLTMEIYNVCYNNIPVEHMMMNLPIIIRSYSHENTK